MTNSQMTAIEQTLALEAAVADIECCAQFTGSYYLLDAATEAEQRLVNRAEQYLLHRCLLAYPERYQGRAVEFIGAAAEVANKCAS